jgi:hypothetical protein
LIRWWWLDGLHSRRDDDSAILYTLRFLCFHLCQTASAVLARSPPLHRFAGRVVLRRHRTNRSFLVFCQQERSRVWQLGTIRRPDRRLFCRRFVPPR